jgi:uncharacterized membrane protein
MFVFAQWLEATPLSVAIKDAGWVVPLFQSIHILTLAVVFSSVLMIAMRVVGAVRMDQPLDAVLRRFSPWIEKGLMILLLTGVTLAIGEPIRQLMSLSFRLKLGLVLVAVVLATMSKRALFTTAGTIRSREQVFSSGQKRAAMATVALWLVIIFLGRAIAYDIEVWGAWSPSPRNSAAN